MEFQNYQINSETKRNEKPRDIQSAFGTDEIAST